MNKWDAQFLHLDNYLKLKNLIGMYIFKKQLPTKKDKQSLDMIFENVKLYTIYLGNAVNHIVFESVIMDANFPYIKHYCKIVKTIIKLMNSIKELIYINSI